MRHVRWIWLAGLLLIAPQGPLRAQGARPPGYAGDASCLECHAKDAAEFTAGAKGKLLLAHARNDKERLGCETCHGPGQVHAESGGDSLGGMIVFSRKSKTPVSDQNAVCLKCHEKTARMYWKSSAHEGRDVACTDCHTLMKAVSERSNLEKPTVLQTCAQCHPQRRGQQLGASHMPLAEGKMECTSCHNPHGSPYDKLLVAPTVNETCYSCHTEKRGPFLWEHAPVVENCANCHDPHGTTKEKMLKVPKPRLCQQCHDETSHPTRPYSTAATYTRFIAGRQCANCHTMIHGSNHPSGFAFTR